MFFPFFQLSINLFFHLVVVWRTLGLSTLLYVHKKSNTLMQQWNKGEVAGLKRMTQDKLE
jgi:hypothetical protein